MTAEITKFTRPFREPPAPAVSPEMPYLEPAPAIEQFCCDLARVHIQKMFTSLIWTRPEIMAHCNDEENIAVCKIFVPTAALPAIHEAIGKAIAAQAGAGEA